MEQSEKIKKSLRYSFIDGIFANGMIGITQDYLTPVLLWLGGSARQIAGLAALPNLFAALVQMGSAELVERFKSRKRVISLFVLLQGAVLLCIVGAIFLKSTPSVFLLFVVLFAVCGALIGPPWGSLMSDHVPDRERGAYFGWRSRILGCVIISTSFVAGLILHLMKKISIQQGFLIIFSVGVVFRVLSWVYLMKMYEPPLIHKKEDYFTLFDFLKRIRQSNFAKFVLFVSMMSFAVNIASPFFAVLMLKDFSFNYLQYTIITLMTPITVYSVISRWGRHADKVGNLKIIRFSSPFIGIIPLLWLINQHPLYLVACQIVAGFVWAGFNLCTSNFIYDAVTPSKRMRCIAYFNVLNGLALCAGALLGGFLLNRLPPVFGHKIFSLFIISALVRIVVAITMPLFLKEVRTVEHIKNDQLFFSMLGVRPLMSVDRRPVRL